LTEEALGYEAGNDPFDIAEPTTLEDATDLLASGGDEVRVLGGGTALMLMTKYGFLRPRRLVSLRRVYPELRGISGDGDEIRIGAMTTLRDLERSDLIRSTLPALGEALGSLANVRIRNVATIGGHLAHADPHMDLPPVLIVLDARVRVVGRGGAQWISVEDLIVGYYETSLAADEIIVEVAIPEQPANHRSTYTKFTALSQDDWPTLGVAVGGSTRSGRMVETRAAVSAIGERPLRLTLVEQLLEEESPSTGLFRQAAQVAADAVDPSEDRNGSAAYKREMIRVHMFRALDRTFQP
jgi:carbon-monoxide dehydrogenase medium subunit